LRDQITDTNESEPIVVEAASATTRLLVRNEAKGKNHKQNESADKEQENEG